jgi:hypothetical protein
LESALTRLTRTSGAVPDAGGVPTSPSVPTQVHLGTTAIWPSALRQRFV